MKQSDVSPSPDLTVVLRAFTVELMGLEVEPQYINPVTLEANDVVDSLWRLDSGTLVGISRSRFGYANGVEVEAEQESLSFRHIAADLVVEEALSAELASRYVKAYGEEDLFGIGMVFQGEVKVPDAPDLVGPFDSAVLTDKLALRNVAPSAYRIGVTHSFEPEQPRPSSLSVDLFRGVAISGVHFTAQAFHEVVGPQHTWHAINSADSILSRWQSVWSDVVDVVTRLAQAPTYSQANDAI